MTLISDLGRSATPVHFFVCRLGSKSVILEFQASSCDLNIRFVDWDWPVPRIGERVWLKALMNVAIDDPHWRVKDVWWEPEPEDDEPVCVVFLEQK